MKFILYALSLGFLVSCASTSPMMASQRDPASAGRMTNLQWLGKTLSSSTNSNCKIEVSETSFGYGKGISRVENIPALVVKVTEPDKSVTKVTVVGEPEITYAKFFSTYGNREKYMQTINAYTIEDSIPDTPNKISVRSLDEGKVMRLVFSTANSVLNGEPPTYSSRAPCEFNID